MDQINIKSMLYGLMFVCSVLFFSSCGKGESLNKNGFNIFGGAGRTSNYEAGGDIYGRTYEVKPIVNTDSSGIVCAPLSLEEYETVIATVNGSIVLLMDRVVTWTKRLDTNEVSATGMCADLLKNIYLISNEGNLYSYSFKGDRRWKIPVDKGGNDLVSYSNLLALKDGIIMANSNGVVAKYSFDGKLLWQYKSNLAVTEVSADDNGNMAVALSNNEPGKTDSLIFISSQGNKLWERGFENLRLLNHPVVFKNRVYATGYYLLGDKHYSKILAFDTKGNSIFSKELEITVRYISCALNGDIYALGYDAGFSEALSGLYAFNSNGKMKWQMFLKAISPMPALVGNSTIGIIGFTSHGPLAFFLNREDGLMSKQLSLSNAPVLYPFPAISVDNEFFLYGSQKLSLIKVKPSFFGTAVPWM